MVAQEIIALLTWLHIFSIVSWFGGALILTAVVEPVMAQFSPQTRGEMALKFFPRILRFIQISSTLAIVFGLLLALGISDGNLSFFFSANTPLGLRITIGAIFGLIVYVFVWALLTPSVRKLGELTKQMQANPQQPPPAELKALQKKIRIGGPTAAILLSIAMAFMVAAVTLP